MTARAGLVLAALCMGFPTAQAETRTAQYGAVFCEDLPSLHRFITGLLTPGTPFDERPDRCEMLKPGVPLDVLRDVAAIDDRHSIVAVRVHGGGGMVHGFTLNIDVEDATPTGP